MTEPLAMAADVAEVLGRDLTSSEAIKVEPILDKASALFRRRAGQEFTEGQSEVRLKVNGGKVYLPQYPVTDVVSVTDDDGEGVDYEQVGQWLDVGLGSDKFVTVVYTHGGEVPDLVRLTVAEVAKRVLLVPESAQTGVTQHSETAGAFTQSDSYATWAQGGQTMLAPDDLAIADSFRVAVPTIWVQ
jgi:hypothetical protein